jgi:predicted nucleic acid-binding protein
VVKRFGGGVLLLPVAAPRLAMCQALDEFEPGFELQREQPAPQVRARFEGLRDGQMVRSSISGAERAFGVAKSGSARDRDALEKFLAPLEVLPFDAAAMHAYDPLLAQFQANGQPIGALETWIAARRVLCERAP